MATLRIQQFSCIDHAEMKLSKLTVIIGPQASGKSVISKLFYFFFHELQGVHTSAERGRSIKDFKTEIVQDFKKWFPPNAWGKKKFSIEFIAEPVSFKIVRTASNRGPSQNVKVELSEFVEEQYGIVLAAFQEGRKKKKVVDDSEEFDDVSFELGYKIRRAYNNRLAKAMGGDHIAGQYFIPAGRSFFTSVGKAIAAFEHGGLLDPVTLRFGRLFAQLRDYPMRYFPPSEREEKGVAAARKQLANQLFGGAIKFDGNNQYVQTDDGRQIPFQLLSSGQQELLPLWMVLDNILRSGDGPNLIYVEEPEAHLFPAAQDLIVSFLAGLVTARSQRRVVITTHSPYVLAKINNMLKAGEVSRKKKGASDPEISKVIPKNVWLGKNMVNAYAVIDRNVINIIGEDSLIDGGYLDGVSNNMYEQFSELLGIENA